MDQNDPQNIPSILKVIASENLDISSDLKTEASDKTIEELIKNNEKKEEE
jgi:hypothetical protein